MMKYTTPVWFALALVFTASCGIQKATEDTRDLVGKSNDKQQHLLETTTKLLQETSQVRSAAHLQILTTALENMLTGPAANLLFPLPALMLPYAEAYTMEADETEILKTEYVLLGATTMPPVTAKEKPEELHTRAVAYSAFGVIAGLTPAEKATNILASISSPKQVFPDTAAAFAAARYNFLKGLLGLKVNPAMSRVINEGVLLEIVKYYSGMKQIASLPMASQLVYSVEIPEILPKNTVSVDSLESLAEVGERTAEAIKTRAPAVYASHPELIKVLVSK